MLDALGTAIFLLTQGNEKTHHQLKHLMTTCERRSSDDILVTSTKGAEFIPELHMTGGAAVR